VSPSRRADTKAPDTPGAKELLRLLAVKRFAEKRFAEKR